MRVLVEDAPVRAHMAGLDILLLADRRNAARRQPRRARADEFGQPTTEFQLRFRDGEAEGAEHQVGGLGEVLEGVFLDAGEEGGVHRIGFAELGDVLVLEDVDVFVVVQVDEDEAEELAEVEAGDHLLEGLLPGAGGLFVDDEVVGCAGQDGVLVVEGAVFAIDGDGHVGVEVQVRDLADRATVLHVGGVAAGAEDAADLHGAVGVVGGDEGAGRVVDQGAEFDGELALLQGGIEERGDVFAFNAGDVEAFGPTLEDTVVDVVLRGGVGEGEA